MARSTESLLSCTLDWQKCTTPHFLSNSNTDHRFCFGGEHLIHGVDNPSIGSPLKFDAFGWAWSNLISELNAATQFSSCLLFVAELLVGHRARQSH